jgi:hypothetical protein
METVERNLQERLVGSAPALAEDSPTTFFDNVRESLLHAWHEGHLAGGMETIYQNVKLTGGDGTFSITGGLKDFSRRPESARIRRDDGAWIHFTITVEWDRDNDPALSLIAYDFEIVFGDERHPRFFRYDLNPPDHSNSERELRSHCHPGNDDYLAPAPVMTPVEIIAVFTAGLRARDPDRPRQ